VRSRPWPSSNPPWYWKTPPCRAARSRPWSRPPATSAASFSCLSGRSATPATGTCTPPSSRTSGTRPNGSGGAGHCRDLRPCARAGWNAFRGARHRASPRRAFWRRKPAPPHDSLFPAHQKSPGPQQHPKNPGKIIAQPPEPTERERIRERRRGNHGGYQGTQAVDAAAGGPAGGLHALRMCQAVCPVFGQTGRGVGCGPRQAGAAGRTSCRPCWMTPGRPGAAAALPAVRKLRRQLPERGQRPENLPQSARQPGRLPGLPPLKKAIFRRLAGHPKNLGSGRGIRRGVPKPVHPANQRNRRHLLRAVRFPLAGRPAFSNPRGGAVSPHPPIPKHPGRVIGIQGGVFRRLSDRQDLP